MADDEALVATQRFLEEETDWCLEEASDAPTATTELLEIAQVPSPKTANCVLTTLPKTRKRLSDSNKARSERRRELRCLRQTMVELERELLELRQPQRAASRRAVRRNMEGPRTQRVLGAWEAIAAHQWCERLRVEGENTRLRGELDSQIKNARQLERLLRKMLITQHKETTPLVMMPVRRKDPVVFYSLLRNIEYRYANIDDIFHDAGIESLEYSHRGAQVLHDEKGTHVQVFHNEVLPGTLLQASGAVWDKFAQNMERVPFRQYYERSREDLFVAEDTFLEHLGINIHVNGMTANFRAQQVLRRYVEDNRVFIMWCALIDAVEFSGIPIAGMHFRRNGCMFFQRPKTLDPDELTILKSLYVITPELTEPMDPTDAMMSKVIEFLLLEGTASAAVTHQLIENMLLEEAMRRSKPREQ
ncbi:hypothetical protein Poli38472_000481 [Pythium oligandrum]|uniref:Uncharacterized protein n=1 Tax=Pythium oligandrum TaxID=41045 RepID=A0A8K1CCD6_PYTOL|nr:hypothetical protein Poli38472_000481 [Pythium oligandrum]|eukprot:TMW60439.1 hypothetical protein Poli38472_000481 [Pythium oligandrum]